MPDINTTIVRWESGGTFTINDGTAYTVLNLEPGTIELDLPPRQVIELYDRTTCTPIRTHRVPDELRFSARFAAPNAAGNAGSLLAVLTADATSGMTPKLFTGTLDFLDSAGVATGRRFTAADWYCQFAGLRVGGIDAEDLTPFVLRSCGGVTESVY